MRDLCRRIGVDSVDVIIALIALSARPMNMLDDYVHRKHGKTKVEYDHPLLEPILKETFGVFVYQEQSCRRPTYLRVTRWRSRSVAACDGQKKPRKWKNNARFLSKVVTRKQDPHAKAEKIFDTLAKFAGYGFNKSTARLRCSRLPDRVAEGEPSCRVHGGIAL